MKIYPLKDGNFYVNKNKDFYNLNDAEGLKGIKLAVQSFFNRNKQPINSFRCRKWLQRKRKAQNIEQY
jgi:hypothetical protein